LNFFLLDPNSPTGYFKRFLLKIWSNKTSLVGKDSLGLTEEAQRVETEIYDQLYGNHLTLVGWYHSSPRGPSLPTVKDCFDQLDFQIKLLGNGDATYTPCVGLICSPYEASARTLDSSIVVYWIYPPSGIRQSWDNCTPRVQWCGSGSEIRYLFDPWIRVSGKGKKIRIRIRDEQPGSYLRELRNSFFG
jgi:hypothetical protein